MERRDFFPFGTIMRAGIALSIVVSTGCGSCNVNYDEEEESVTLSLATDPHFIGNDEALAALDSVKKACSQGDAKSLWKLLHDRNRESYEEEARNLRDLGISDLRGGLGYEGTLEEFDGFQLVRTTMHEPAELCDGHSSWKVDLRGMLKRERFVIVSRPTGSVMGTFVSRDGDGKLRVRASPWRTPAP